VDLGEAERRGLKWTEKNLKYFNGAGIRDERGEEIQGGSDSRVHRDREMEEQVAGELEGETSSWLALEDFRLERVEDCPG